MRKKIRQIHDQLDELYDSAVDLDCSGKQKFVVFSDLHMGDGSTKDDFLQNAQLFTTALKDFYFKKDYHLILNGDIEELQRFSLEKIQQQWSGVYDVFEMFSKKNLLSKIIGNHDLQLCLPSSSNHGFEVLHSVNLRSRGGDILIFHGHQASMVYKKLNKLISYTLKYLANPLRIRNYSVARDSRKKYTVEKRVYQYSNSRKRVSIIGHTHRPLFESLSHAERLKFKIEQLCREFSSLRGVEQRKPVKKLIKSHKQELEKIYAKNKAKHIENNLYDSVFHIPSLFNSGCVIGKRGMTCLEIDRKEIALVHWFDQKTTKKYIGKRGYKPKQLNGTDYFRMTLSKENLKYIFTRINLLT